MAYKIQRERRIWRPWYWELILSSHGMEYGYAWTKRGAARALIMCQGRWFAE